MRVARRGENMKLFDAQLEIQANTRAFMKSNVLPYAAQFDRTECLPKELLQELSRAGFFGATIPSEFGGHDWDEIGLGLMHEEMGRVCSSVRSLFTVHGMVCRTIQRWGTNDQRKRWLPALADGSLIGAFGISEEQAGSDISSIEAEIIKCPGGYMVNGRKKWVTFGQIADVVLIFAKHGNEPVTLLLEPSTKGVTVSPVTGILGLRASMTAEITMENVFIREDQIIGRPGFGLSHIALSALDYGRYSIAWGCVGMGQACINQSVAYASQRKQFGEEIIRFQLVKKMISEIIVQVQAARLLCIKAGHSRINNDPNAIIDTWNAKYFASTMASTAASSAIQIHGANGCLSERHVERIYRDAKIMELIEGTTQLHEVMIADHAASFVDWD